jgi:hypothetical protein
MVKVKEEYLRRRKSCYIFKNNVHSEKKVMVTKKKIKFFFLKAIMLNHKLFKKLGIIVEVLSSNPVFILISYN